jgi:hypothetical protein
MSVCCSLAGHFIARVLRDNFTRGGQCPTGAGYAGDSSIVPPFVVKWRAFAFVAANENDLQALQSRRADSNR